MSILLLYVPIILLFFNFTLFVFYITTRTLIVSVYTRKEK